VRLSKTIGLATTKA